MNRQETSKIVASITAAYPNHFKGYTTQQIDSLINTWCMVMDDYTYPQASAGLKIFLASDTKGFPPSPGQVIDCILKITKPESAEMSEGEAWHIARKAIERGSAWAEEDFEKMPPNIQKALGSPANIRSMATDSEYNEEVAKSQFLRAYRSILTREREEAKIPSKVMALIQNTVKQIEAKEKEA